MKSLKQQLYHCCCQQVKKQLEQLEARLQSQQNALLTETKSSAGDKHETGRAMLQLEMEKTGKQHQNLCGMLTILEKIDPSQSQTKACLGTVVHTDASNYFLAASIGKVIVEGQDYFVVSCQSPIGKQLLGKSKGDAIEWGGHTQRILWVD